MVSSLAVVGTDFLSKAIVLKQLGMSSLGLYQATWTLSNLYVTIILSAMGADFFPRLSALADDHIESNKLVNEQLEMGLLLGTPGILVTLTLAPTILSVFYSSEFVSAAQIIRWQILGIFLRLLSWPPGYLQLSQKRAKIFATGEVIFSVVQIAIIYLSIKLWSIQGMGIAFAVSYLLHTVATYLIAKYLTNFTYSTASYRIIFLSTALILVTWLTQNLLPRSYGIVLGMMLSLLSLVTSYKFLKKLLDFDPLKMAMRKLKLT
jgi:PST family polysaccharide transporter